MQNADAPIEQQVEEKVFFQVEEKVRNLSIGVSEIIFQTLSSRKL